MLTNELMNRQLQRYRDLTALGYRFKAHHQYFNAELSFESSVLTLYPLYRADGCRDRRPYDIENVKLNHRNLSHIHLDYKLNFIFQNDNHWYNTYPRQKLLDDCLKRKPSMIRALASYESVNLQNILLNADIKLRQRFGCFGLIAINDYYLERRHGLVRRQANRWIDNADKLANKSKAKSRQFKRIDGR